jgi:hypothetical protein
MRDLVGIVLALLLVVGCQSAAPPLSLDEAKTLSLDDAKKVTADFAGTGFLPPPRTITDITAILDSVKPDEEYRAAATALMRSEPPPGASPGGLSEFYQRRARAAMLAGLPTQALADARESVRYARISPQGVLVRALSQLLNAQWASGDPDVGTTVQEIYALTRATGSSPGVFINLVIFSIDVGDLAAARHWVVESDQH